MEKIRMYRVGMNGWQKTCKSIEEALACRPEFEFIDSRLKRQYPLEVEEAKPMDFTAKVDENTPEVVSIPEEVAEEAKPEVEFDYNTLSEKEKKQYLEEIAREHGVEIDKRKKLEDLEKIVDDLMEG